MGRANDEVGGLGLSPNLSLEQLCLYSKVKSTSSIVIRHVHHIPKMNQMSTAKLIINYPCKIFSRPAPGDRSAQSQIPAGDRRPGARGSCGHRIPNQERYIPAPANDTNKRMCTGSAIRRTLSDGMTWPVPFAKIAQRGLNSRSFLAGRSHSSKTHEGSQDTHYRNNHIGRLRSNN